MRDALRAGLIDGGDDAEVRAKAQERGVISAEDAERLARFDELVMSLIAVDDFHPSELRQGESPQIPDVAEA